MIKKIPLPLHSELDGYKFLPMGEGGLHAWITRKSTDGVQMIRHEQAKAAVPEEFCVIMCHGREHASANAGLAKLVFARRHAFERDKK